MGAPEGLQLGSFDSFAASSPAAATASNHDQALVIDYEHLADARKNYEARMVNAAVNRVKSRNTVTGHDRPYTHTRGSNSSFS